MANRSIVVTGAGAGIGRAIADRLATEGWHVVGVELNHRQSDADFAGELLLGDVADRAVLAAARARAELGGTLMGWVNNAGVALGGNLHAPVPADVERVLGVNLGATYWGCAEAVQSYIDTGTAGAIVNISSIHGRVAFPGWAAYDTAKGGVEALTRYIAVEYGLLGIRANAVAPGAIRTELVARVVAESADPDIAERDMALLHPLERLGEPFEVAAVVSFLLSEESSFVSGQSLAVDGGATARAYRYDPPADLLGMRRERAR